MKYLKISKELIKAVLQKETEILSKDFNFTINEDYIEFSDDGEMQFEYCIYKFAFKCKEWMVTQGYGIKTETYDYMEDDLFSGTYWYIIKLRAKNWKDGGCPNCGANATEIEAIMQACEWILSEVNK